MNIYKNDVGSTQRKLSADLRTRAVAAMLASLVAVATPLIETPAFAQNPTVEAVPKVDAAAAQKFAVTGTQYVCSDGKTSVNAYSNVKDANETTVIEVAGPSKLTVRFYPIVKKEWFPAADSDYQREIKYGITPANGGEAQGDSFKAPVKMSELKCTGEKKVSMPDTMAMGTVMTMTLKIPTGNQRVTFQSTGFVEIVGVEEEGAAPASVPVAQSQPIVTSTPIESKTDPTQQATDNGFAFNLRAEHLFLDGLGDGKNHGMITDSDISFGKRWTKLGVYGGVIATSYGMTLDTPSATSALRSTSVDAQAGLTLNAGKHTIRAGPFVGLRMDDPSIIPLVATQPATINMAYALEYGGLAEYDYNRMVGLMVRGSNNPFNPLTAGVYGVLPWGWVKDNQNPSLEFTMRWMHLMRADTDGKVGGFKLDENNLFMYANLKVPVWKLGPITPALLASLQMDKAPSGMETPNFLVGAMLYGKFAERFRMEAGAAANVTNGKPMIFLGLRY